MDDRDQVIAVAAAHRLGLVASRLWPMVAAHLLAAGHGGAHVTQLAGLPATVSAWEVDQLVPQVLLEVAAPDLSAEQAGDVVARLFVLVRHGDDHPVVRALAALAPATGYPGGLIARAYEADEWLECACHGPATADQLEAELASLPPLALSPPMAQALTSP